MTQKPQHPLLLIEDDTALAQLITDELEAEGWTLHAVNELQQARQWLAEHQPSLIVTDLRLPDGYGMDLVHDIMDAFSDDNDPDRPGVIVITAFGSVPQAVEALQAGADDFLTKPLDLDHFLLSVRRVLDNRTMRHELSRFRALSRDQGFHGIYGQSEPMRRLFEQIRVIGRANGPVLINGESGTGKELVARALFQESDRAEGPFLAVNCAGIPQELLESEFFGHASGAFTGAKKSRKGLLQEADGGTLLLDEIAEMPLSLQAKLLRALQDGSIRPVGQDTEEHVDVRIIAATHRDLKQRVEAGEFREDLYYRLETFTLQVPPLRERGEDCDLLAQRFVQQHSTAQDRAIEGLSNEAMQLLRQYPFPGNVRELQNIVERAVAFCNDAWIQPAHLPARLHDFAEHGKNGDSAAQAGILPVTGGAERSAEPLLHGTEMPTLEELQRRYVNLVLDRVQGNKRQAASILGIGRRTLYRWLDDLQNAEHEPPS